MAAGEVIELIEVRDHQADDFGVIACLVRVRVVLVLGIGGQRFEYNFSSLPFLSSNSQRILHTLELLPMDLADLEGTRLQGGLEPVGMTNEDHLVNVEDFWPTDDLAVRKLARIEGTSGC